MLISFRPPLAIALAVLFSTASPCLAKERQKVMVSYVVAPTAPLPEGLQTVAVLDTGVESAGPQQSERERKWSTIAADMMEAMLQDGTRYGAPLRVANRRETQKVLAEKDLKLAGLVDGATAGRAGKLLDVQGLITSRLTINIDTQRTTKSNVDWTSVLGGLAGQLNNSNRTTRVYRETRYYHDPRTSYSRRRTPDGRVYTRSRHVNRPPTHVVVEEVPVVRRSPSPSFQTKEVEEISRHLTVQCVFSLIDAATGQTLLQYAPPPFQKQDNLSPDFLFGGGIDEADLDPVDHFIGELVEHGVQEFASQLVPVEITDIYELVGKHDEGEAGIRALRADDPQRAMELFQQWRREEPDEHEAIFALGVTSALLGQYEQALGYYRQAAGMEDVDEDDELPIYLRAKNRLAAHLPRILQPQAPAPPVNQPEAAPPEAAPSVPAPQQ